MSKLVIKGKYLDITEIASGNCTYLPQSETEVRVFDFITRWFDPQAAFEVKTSGSTGVPKMLKITRKSMQLSSEMTAEALKLTSNMTALLAMDPKYIGGMMMIARACTLGTDLVITDPSINPFQNLQENLQIDFTALVPLQIKEIMDKQGPKRLNQMQAILVGGGPVSKDLELRISTLEVPVYHTYGMTETISHIALRRLNGIARSNYYESLPGIKIRKNERGCLVVSGAFIDGEVITNDMIDMISDEEFVWLGRVDNMINSGGVKLNPELLEPIVADIIQKHNFQSLPFILGGIPDEKLGQQMVMFVEGDLQGKDTKLLQILKSEMEEYHSPKRIIEIKKFQKTETGKIQRHKIIDFYQSES